MTGYCSDAVWHLMMTRRSLNCTALCASTPLLRATFADDPLTQWQQRQRRYVRVIDAHQRPSTLRKSVPAGSIKSRRFEHTSTNAVTLQNVLAPISGIFG